MQNHLKLLCDFSELNWVFSESRSLEKFLGRLVVMVAEHMQTRVCSLYLFDEAAGELRLQATHGLKAGAAGRVHLRVGEGPDRSRPGRTASDRYRQGQRPPRLPFFRWH